MSLDIELVKKEVSTLLSGDKSGHADDHTFRVYDLAMKLCEQEKADTDAVALAALLHDCDDYKVFGQESADQLINAKRIMNFIGVDNQKQNVVCDIIHNMGYSKLLKGIRPNSIEGMIVSDADMLDAIGTLGIIRCLVFSVHRQSGQLFDRSIFPKDQLTPEEYKIFNRTTDNFINHFFDKLLKLKNLMLTRAGKKEAEPRHEIMVEFLRHFFKEQDLSDWNDYLEKFLQKN